MHKDDTPAIRLSVSIVLYNSSLKLLQRALDSLQCSARMAQHHGCVDHVSVYVIDNSSDMQCREQASQAVSAWQRADFFAVEYIGMPDNRGFSVGHNSVLERIDSDFHLVLNPDAELSEDVLLIGLRNLEDDPGIALISPRVFGEDGRQQYLCKRYPSVLVFMVRAFAPHFIQRLFRKRLYRYEMRDVCSGEGEAEIMLATGCFMLVRTAALLAVGGFNDKYFLYFEDFDLSLRLGSQGRLVFNPEMKIVHHGGYAATKGMRHIKYFVRSGISFFNDHGWRWI